MSRGSDSDSGSDPDRGCRRCGHDEARVGEIAVSNSGFQAIADIDARKMQVIYCTRCGYTEHYHSNADEESLADLFFTEL